MIPVGFILLTYNMGPERCYQWENYVEFVDKYYKSLKEKAKLEETWEALKENLAKWPVVEDKERPFHKKEDAKDAVYFIGI